MQEEWREVVGYDGWYDVNQFGDIRSWRKRGSNIPDNRDSKPNPMHPGHNKKGYAQIGLRLNGVDSWKLVHHLVFEAFVGPIPDGMEINHIDGNKDNNTVGNLELTTRSGNMKHASEHGLVNRGEDRYNAKLSDEIVAYIRFVFENKPRRGLVSEFARKFGVSIKAISLVKLGKTWKHVKPAPLESAAD